MKNELRIKNILARLIELLIYYYYFLNEQCVFPARIYVWR